jgi:hypothetical protein
LATKSARGVHENSHLLVARPVEPHPGSRASDATIHLGDGNGSPRLPLDLVEEAGRDARREGEHASRLAGRTSQNLQGFVPERHKKTK